MVEISIRRTSRTNRRESLKLLGKIMGVSTVAFAVGTCGAVSSVESTNRDSSINKKWKEELTPQLNDKYPLTDPKNLAEMKQLKKDYEVLNSNVQGLARTEQLDKLTTLLNTPQSRGTLLGRRLYDTQLKARQDEEEEFHNKYPKSSFGLGLIQAISVMIGSGVGFIGMAASGNIAWNGLIRRDHRRYIEARTNYDPLIQLSYLPPVGGKLMVPAKDVEGDKGIWYILPPTQTAEEHVEIVKALKKQKKIDNYFVHQLTIQGRLRGNFHYAALALILNSPYHIDWEEPSYEAEWGKVAPLVHDGGVTNFINGIWSNPGRTDFLNRLQVVQEPDFERILQQRGRENQPFAQIAPALFERQEQERLFLESRFYQRIAFAYHCARESAPEKIPFNIRQKGAYRWLNFEREIEKTLLEIGAYTAMVTPWFDSTARELWGYKDRYEASYETIKDSLVRFEQLRWRRNPDLLIKMRNFLTEVADGIDSVLGTRKQALRPDRYSAFVHLES